LQLADFCLFPLAASPVISPPLLAMTRLTRAGRHFYLLATAALRLLNNWESRHDFFIFIIHKNLLFTGKKATRNDLQQLECSGSSKLIWFCLLPIRQ
jgi:hypothetical protein